ncbi:MAG: type II secretion system protein N [Pseudomonadota bacterium]
MTPVRALVLFVLTLVLALLLQLPVGLFINDSGRLGPVQLYAVEGTLWQGRADGVAVAGQRLENVSWDVQPLYLLLGQARAQLGFNYLEGQGRLQAAITPTGKLLIREATYRAPADAFTQQFAQGFVGLRGDIELQIDALEHRMGEPFPDRLDGFAYWQNAAASYPVSAGLGNLSLALSQTAGEGDSGAGALVAELSNQGGEISIDGTARLTANRQYAVDASLTPTDALTDTLKATLDSALQADSEGVYRFKRQGTLRP